MNVPEVEAFIEGKTLFTGTRVKNQVAAGLSGRPATFSGWPAIYFFRNGRPAISLHNFGRPAPKDGRQCCSVSSWPCFTLRGRVPSIFMQRESQRPSSPSVSDAFRCPDHQKYTLLSSCLSSCCFDYRVVLLIELFVERTCFVFLSHCALFKQSLLKSCLFTLSTLLHFAYRVVNFLRFCYILVS